MENRERGNGGKPGSARDGQVKGTKHAQGERERELQRGWGVSELVQGTAQRRKKKNRNKGTTLIFVHKRKVPTEDHRFPQIPLPIHSPIVPTR